MFIIMLYTCFLRSSLLFDLIMLPSFFLISLLVLVFDQTHFLYLFVRTNPHHFGPRQAARVFRAPRGRSQIFRWGAEQRPAGGGDGLLYLSPCKNNMTNALVVFNVYLLFFFYAIFGKKLTKLEFWTPLLRSSAFFVSGEFWNDWVNHLKWWKTVNVAQQCKKMR